MKWEHGEFGAFLLWAAAISGISEGRALRDPTPRPAPQALRGPSLHPLPPEGPWQGPEEQGRETRNSEAFSSVLLFGEGGIARA